ncbi:hypothetical protein FBR02_11820 [Anaerolineae bacterium CFX9]|nr:hypothetical protein [Anaerolineae bacterium CFX9]
MNGGTIRINNIRIRVTTGTITPAQGQQLGERVQSLLAERLAGKDDIHDRDISTIRLSLRAETSVSIEQIAGRVVDAILRQL